MIKFINGNLFEVPADILVNAVNCVGVMGGGIALEFKNRYPEMYEDYKIACSENRIRPGKIHIWTGHYPQTIVNFPTKGHYRHPSFEHFITDGLKELRYYLISVETRIGDSQLNRINIPALGCGLGGLKWSFVAGQIVDILGVLESEISVFNPQEH